MNMNIGQRGRARKWAGFSLIETMVAIGVVGTVTTAMLTGIMTGTFTTQLSRENLRATQIMLEKVETLRLYSWDQINTAGFIPSTFSATYDPQSTNNVGLTYTGTLSINPAPIGTSYSNDLRQVTVTLNWKTGGIQRSRNFNTYVCRNGLQDYIY